MSRPMFWLAVGLACAACQSTHGAAGRAPGGMVQEAPAPMARSWEDMSKDEKRELMKLAVVPRMNQLFHEYNAQRYPQVRCTFCHGEGAKKGSFGMPNPDLPRLGFADHLARERADKPEMVAFMSRKVVPEMAAALGVPPFDPATGKGFGCKDCHSSRD
jgi:hypothetical protein